MADRRKYDQNLHKGARPSTYKNANSLRRRATEAEEKLWPFLRNRKLNGLKFRRQHPVDRFILDFYCHECKLAVELDGGIHDSAYQQLYDEARTAILNRHGIRVIRFRNEEVLKDPQSVLEKIAASLQ